MKLGLLLTALILGLLLSTASIAANAPADAACDTMPPGLIGFAPTLYASPVRLDVQGDYAYLVDWLGNFEIFDISDPCNPTSTGAVQWVGNEFADVKVVGNYAYIANDADGLAKYDVSDPAKPFRIDARSDGTYTVSVDYNEQYLFASHIYTPSPSLVVYDMATFPADPIATYTIGSGLDHNWEVVVEGDRAYIFATDGPAPRFQVLDISNLPDPPVLLGSLDLPPGTYGYGFGLKAAGSYVYLARMDHYPYSGSDGGLLVINVSNGANPFVEGMVTVPNAGLSYWKRPGLDVHGDMVYVPGQDGLYGYDVSDPANPMQTTHYPYPASFGPMGSGDVVIRGNLAYVSAFYPDGDPAVNRGGLAIYNLDAANRAPVAYSDSYITRQNTMLRVPAPGVLANDRDDDGDALTAIRLMNPDHGRLSLDSDGSFVYFPDYGYTGPDRFTYKVSDGLHESETADVDIFVWPNPHLFRLMAVFR